MNDYLLRLKLLIKDRTAGICYIVSSVLILAVMLGLNLNSEVRSSLPVGLVCMDHSSEAEELSGRIKASESLYVYEGSFDELNDLLLDGYINCIFVIKEGYGENVTAGRTDGLIGLYAARDDKISAIISDIVAGCMMDEICLDKAYLRYSALEDEVRQAEMLDRDAYTEYVSAMAQDESFSFVFDTSYIDAGTGEYRASDITNGMIYRQMIGGMLGMLFMLICFCANKGIATEYENGIMRRRKTFPSGTGLRSLGDVFAVFTYSLPVIVLSSLLLSGRLGFAGTLRILSVNAGFVLVCALFFLAAAHVSRGVFSYQLLGTVLLIVSGAMGFISVFEGLLGVSLFRYTPIAVYIDQFIKTVS